MAPSLRSEAGIPEKVAGTSLLDVAALFGKNIARAADCSKISVVVKGIIQLRAREMAIIIRDREIDIGVD